MHMETLREVSKMHGWQNSARYKLVLVWGNSIWLEAVSSNPSQGKPFARTFRIVHNTSE